MNQRSDCGMPYFMLSVLCIGTGVLVVALVSVALIVF